MVISSILVTFFLICILLYKYELTESKYNSLETEDGSFTEIDIPSNYASLLKESEIVFAFLNDNYTYCDIYTIEDKPQYEITKYQFSYCQNVSEKFNDMSFLSYEHKLDRCYTQKISSDRFEYLKKISKKSCNINYKFDETETYGESCFYVKNGTSMVAFSMNYVMKGELFYDKYGNHKENLYDSKYIHVHNFVRDIIINSWAVPQHIKGDDIRRYIELWKEDVF